ncbi:MAG: helix-turn-helix transcriptional regulator, partial [Clostridiales bacterium]|nr:helix-turn-helix transcriptional regulator [Clostridiales bacterium]
NTLCRIAAREGGAHPWDIDQYSRDISIQLENAASVRELTAIREPMLREYCALAGAARKKEFSPAVQQAVNLVDAGFSEHITLQDAAEEVSLSANYLSLRFRQETGKTFSEYLTDVRMERARQMLAGTDLPVTVVAAECGIPDNNYFSRLFRRTENMSPREYRMKHRGK